MSKSIPKTLTIEEAVALMIGLDYIPCGLTVLDMTAAFLEESEIELEGNTRSESFGLRHSACLARHQLAQSLLSALTHEASNADTEFLVRSDDVSPTVRFSKESLNHWAQDQFGITLWAPSKPDDQSEELAGVKWRDVTIKIYADYSIRYRIKDRRYETSSFHDIGLMGRRKNAPNERGKIFLTLAMGIKFPNGAEAKGAQKTSISFIRTALEKLVPLRDEDPFYSYNVADGWKPKFKLIDDRRNADERAKKEAVNVSLDPEAPDFEDENDDGGQWLKNQGYR